MKLFTAHLSDLRILKYCGSLFVINIEEICAHTIILYNTFKLRPPPPQKKYCRGILHVGG